MKTINKVQYKIAKLKYLADLHKNDTVEISDEEYELLSSYINNIKPSSNTPQEYPNNTIRKDPNINKLEYLHIEALENGYMIFDTNPISPGNNNFHIAYFHFAINNHKFINHTFNENLNEEYNIYTYEIHKGDKIYIYATDNIGGIYFPNINFNYKICGNILTYKKDYHSYYLNEEQLNLNNINFYLPQNENCLLYDIYVPEGVILTLGNNYYTSGYIKSHETINYIYFKNENLLLKKITSSQLAHYYNNRSYWSLSEYYSDNIYYTKKDNNCYLLIDKEDFSTNDLYMDMIQSNIGRDYVTTENDIDYYTKYLYKLDFLINIRQTLSTGKSVIIGKTEYENIFILKNINYNWDVNSFESDSYIINNQQYEINEDYKIIHTINNNDKRINIIEYNPNTFEFIK